MKQNRAAVVVRFVDSVLKPVCDFLHLSIIRLKFVQIAQKTE